MKLTKLQLQKIIREELGWNTVQVKCCVNRMREPHKINSMEDLINQSG